MIYWLAVANVVCITVSFEVLGGGRYAIPFNADIVIANKWVQQLSMN